MSKKSAPSATELLHQIKDQVSENPSWSEPFDRLMQAIAAIGRLENGKGSLTCDQAREAFDIVVADELAGLNLDRQRHAVLSHLAQCGDCRIAYSLLRETLLAEQEGRLVPIPTSPPAASPQPLGAAVPWRRQDGTSPYPFPLTFQIARDFISKALLGPQLAFARGEIADERERKMLLLADIVPIEGGNLLAEATIHRQAGQPEMIGLEVQLVSDRPLPEGLQASLLWADVQRSGPVTEGGKIYFPDLPLLRLTEPGSDNVRFDLTLSFSCA